ncbi:hypothetical protein ACFVXE_11320 [Streptomyces sp. NPDC058231]|uniref:hypothetical protein n=1 Tax=Streptomyces sp. NPDC058231 TaxID=3346392 RepID=UPI0036EE9ADB
MPWSAADPDGNAFEWNDEEEAWLTAQLVLIAPAVDAEQGEKSRFTSEATRLLVSRYGRWACGWDWEVRNGGAVTGWCCSSHSVGDPAETAARVVACLLEWRDWLEDMANRFERLAPPPEADAEDRSWHLERAAIRLVTTVVDHTGAESGWHNLCCAVLTWFLSSAGLGPEDAQRAVEAAIGGRFRSWSAPTRTVLDTVGQDLAVSLTGRRPYRDW